MQQQQWETLKTQRHKQWVFEQKQLQQQRLQLGTGASSAELWPQHQQQPPAPQQQQQPSVQQQDHPLRSAFSEDLQQQQQDPLRSAFSEDLQPQQQQEPQQQEQGTQKQEAAPPLQQQEPQEQEQGTQQQQQQQPVEQVSISARQQSHESDLVAQGLQVYHRNFTVGGAIVKAMGADNSTLNIWDIPMQRQLEMAVCRQPLPHINVGANAREQGAWMSFLWDKQTSSLKEDL